MKGKIRIINISTHIIIINLFFNLFIGIIIIEFSLKITEKSCKFKYRKILIYRSYHRRKNI